MTQTSLPQFLCSECSCPAWFCLDGGMLCPDHAAQHVMAGVKDMIEQSRNSACSSLEAPLGSNEVAPGSDGMPGQERPSTSLPNPFLTNNTTTLRMAADSSIQDSVCSFPMGTAGHTAIVDAHNTIVRGG